MTLLGIELSSAEPLANTLTTWPIYPKLTCNINEKVLKPLSDSGQSYDSNWYFRVSSVASAFVGKQSSVRVDLLSWPHIVMVCESTSLADFSSVVML